MILSVLKIIGMVLLVILALLILILGTILFVPIHYRFDGEYVERANLDAQVKWNPVLLKISAYYHNDKFEYVIRMFGGVIMTNQDIPLSWIGRKISAFSNTTQSKEENFEQVESPTQNVSENQKEDSQKQEKMQRMEEISTQNAQVKNNTENENNVTKKNLNGEKQDKRRRKESKRFIFKNIHDKINEIRRRILQIIEKLKTLNEKREQLLKVYHSKRFEIAKKDVWIYVKKLWKMIKPKKLEGYIHFGLKDPASTGQVLAGMSMFLMFYDKFLKIVPDFEKACFDGFFRGKGKIRLFPILKLLIEIRFNKNLIKVIKKVQTIIEM